MLGRVKFTVKNKHGRHATLNFFGIYKLRVNTNSWSRWLHGKCHFGTGDGGSVFLHGHKAFSKAVTKKVANNWLRAHVCQRDKLDLFGVDYIASGKATFNQFFLPITVNVPAKPSGSQHNNTAVAVSALGGNYALTWYWGWVTGVESQIVFQCTSLVSTGRAIGSMVGKFFKVNVRELFFGLMDCHGVIETTEVLILNGGDGGVADKIMLGNVFNFDFGFIAGQFVFGTVDYVGIKGVANVCRIWFTALLRICHCFLHGSLQVHIDLSHVLALGGQTLFASHDFKRTQLILCAFDLFILGNGPSIRGNHNNAIFVQTSILSPISNDLIRVIFWVDHVLGHLSGLIGLIRVHLCKSFKLKVDFAVGHQALGDDGGGVINAWGHHRVNVINASNGFGRVWNRNIEVVIVTKPVVGILGLRQSKVIHHLDVNFMSNFVDQIFISGRAFNAFNDYVLFI